jgi:hypothetical protein
MTLKEKAGSGREPYQKRQTKGKRKEYATTLRICSLDGHGDPCSKNSGRTLFITPPGPTPSAIGGTYFVSTVSTPLTHRYHRPPSRPPLPLSRSIERCERPPDGMSQNQGPSEIWAELDHWLESELLCTGKMKRPVEARRLGDWAGTIRYPLFSPI